MKKLLFVVLFAAALNAQAGIPEVLQAEQEVAVAKAKVKALKAALTKREKAELAVAMAQAKLEAVKD